MDATEDATASGAIPTRPHTVIPKANMKLISPEGGKRFEWIDILIWGLIIAGAVTFGVFCPG